MIRFLGTAAIVFLMAQPASAQSAAECVKISPKDQNAINNCFERVITALEAEIAKMKKPVLPPAQPVKVCAIYISQNSIAVVSVPSQWTTGACKNLLSGPKDHGGAFIIPDGQSLTIVEGCLFPDGRVSVPAKGDGGERTKCGW